MTPIRLCENPGNGDACPYMGRQICTLYTVDLPKSNPRRCHSGCNRPFYVEKPEVKGTESGQ